jgi:hypothetical protein
MVDDVGLNEVRSVEYFLELYRLGIILPEQFQAARDFAHEGGYNIFLAHGKDAYNRGKWEILQKMMEATIENAY